MYVLSLILVATAGPAVTTPIDQDASAIPKKFWGEWARSPGDCNSRGGENSSGFTVSARTIVYYEESEEVQQVRETGPNSLSYTSKFSSTDGEEPSTGMLRLSSDGKRMLGADRSEDLVRCTK